MQIRDPDSVASNALEAFEDPTVPLPPPAAGMRPCPIVALSDDPLLLEALSGAASHGVSSSPSADRFIDQLVANGASLALIDATCVSTSLKSFIATLHEQFPQLLLLVAGSAQLQIQLAPQIAEGSVFRFVHKPASSQRLRLFLDAALRQQAAADSHGPAVSSAPASAWTPATQARGGHRGLVLGVLIVGVLAAGAVGWLLWQRPSAPPADSLANAPGAAPAGNADTEPTAPAMTAPAPQRPVTDSQPEHAQAPAVAATRERDAALEQAQRTAQGARADQLAVYLQLAQKRLASGLLIDPADDSARTYLDSALALAPDDPQVRAVSLELGEAMIAQFRHAIATGDLAGAQHWLAACTNYHIGSATLAQLATQLQQLQAAQPAPTPVTAPAPPVPAAPPPTITAPVSSPSIAVAGPVIAPTAMPAAAALPPTTSAAMAAPATAAPVAAPPATATGAPTVISEASLTRVSFVTPAYPQEALESRISGWVEMEFTVTTEGKVSDVKVIAADPKDVFERAASSALARSRYQPVLRDGVPVAQRAHLRVRFKP